MYVLLPDVYLLIFGCRRIAEARGSIASENKSGERGQHCRVPLPSLKNSDLQPGIFILVLGLMECFKSVKQIHLCNIIFRISANALLISKLRSNSACDLEGRILNYICY